MKQSYIYVLWCNLKRKCYSIKHPRYSDWGGRGIRIHEPWIHEYVLFESWISQNLGPRPDGMSLDRKDNDGHYEPGNLQWTTAMDQNRNRRDSRGEMRGVYPDPRNPAKWIVYVNRKFYGQYEDLEFAKQVRDAIDDL